MIFISVLHREMARIQFQHVHPWLTKQAKLSRCDMLEDQLTNRIF